MHNPKLFKVGAVACSCAAIGAGAGVLGSAFASSPSPSGGAHASSTTAGHQHKRHGVLRRVVHANLVVAAKGGKFVNATLDRGLVTAVNGNRITLREGTRKATYKTVTLTIPAGARVHDNRRKAALGDVKPGQRAIVLRRPKHTAVHAHDVKRR